MKFQGCIKGEKVNEVCPKAGQNFPKQAYPLTIHTAVSQREASVTDSKKNMLNKPPPK